MTDNDKVVPFRPQGVGAEVAPPAQGRSPKAKKPKAPARTSPTSLFGSQWRVGEFEKNGEEELKEKETMVAARKLLYQRSERKGEHQWNTVKVYNDGIEVERRKYVVQEDGTRGWEVHIRPDPILWNRPVYPVATVMVHSANCPKDPESDPTSTRKIRWVGRDFSAVNDTQVVVGTSFDPMEVKAQKADSWFPVRESIWPSVLLPWFRVMILNDPSTLFRNPSDPPNTPVDQLPSLPVEHRWDATGWCSPDKYAASKGEVPQWEHITPDHPLYAGPYQHGYVSVAGNEDLYRKMMTAAIARRPLLGVWCGMAAGALARGLHNDDARQFRGDTSTMVVLHGETGCGKTTTAQLMISLVGQAIQGRLMISDSTSAALELIAQMTNHGFFVIDELQKHLAAKKGPSEAVQHLMGLLNGTGKLASANAGENIRKQRSYDNLILATANAPLSVLVGRNAVVGDGHFSEALEQRVVDIDAALWSPFPSAPKDSAEYEATNAEINDLTATLAGTHGHLYGPIIAHYKEHRVEIVSQLGAWRKHYVETMATKARARMAHFFAYTEVGMAVLGELLDLPAQVRAEVAEQWKAMVEWINNDAKRKQDEAKDDQVDKIVQWVDAHTKSFGVRTTNRKQFPTAYAWPMGASQASAQVQANEAQQRSLNASAQSLWGYWCQNEPMAEEGAWTGELWISSAGKQAMENEKSALPLADMLPKLYARGWLDATMTTTTDAQGNKVEKLERFDKKSSEGWYYRILVGKARAEIAALDALAKSKEQPQGTPEVFDRYARFVNDAEVDYDDGAFPRD